MATQGSARGVVGVFLILLGAGFILDADQWVGGGITLAGGCVCLVAPGRRRRRIDGARS